MRFNEDLRSAGEDHLFFFDLVVASDEVCLSTEIEVELGRGVNIYRSVMSWDNPLNLARCHSFLRLQKTMLHRYNLAPELHEMFYAESTYQAQRSLDCGGTIRNYSYSSH